MAYTHTTQAILLRSSQIDRCNRRKKWEKIMMKKRKLREGKKQNLRFGGKDDEMVAPSGPELSYFSFQSFSKLGIDSWLKEKEGPGRHEYMTFDY
eukprot:scaffold4174_cov182-Ochromonas_danica.AAC.7